MDNKKREDQQKKLKELENFAKKLADSQVDSDPKFEKALRDNFWDLLA